MANTKVTTGVIKDDAVGADQLASNAVVTASITDNAITTAKINDNAILTAKINDSAITNAKMSSNSVDSDQYVDASIDTAHIRDGQITSAKLDTNIAVDGTLTVGSHLIMGDGDILKMGASADLQIYHDGSHSRIVDAGTGNLSLQGNDFRLKNSDASATYMEAANGGSVSLFYAGAVKLATATGGVTVTGTISSGAITSTGNVTLSSTAPLLYLTNTTSGTGKNWRFSSASNGKLFITQEGVIDAVTLDHTTGNATFAGTISSGAITTSGNLTASQSVLGIINNDIRFKTSGDETMLRAVANGAVEIMYSNSTKLATTSTGIDVTGTITGDDGLSIQGGSGNAFLQVGSDTGSWTWKNYRSSHKLALEDSDGTGEVLSFSTSGAATFNSTIASTGATLSGVLELDASGNIPTNGIGLHTNNFVYLRGGSSGLIASSQSGGENFRLNANGIVFNEDSGDLDFRVESNGNTHMLFVDGGNDRVGIGTSSPTTKLDVTGDGLQIRLDGTANTSRGIMLRNTGTAEGQIQTDGNMHFIQEDAGKYMRFSTANTERMRIASNGFVQIGTTTAGGVFTVTNAMSTNDTLMQLNDAGGTGNHTQIEFRNTNGQVGTINTSGSATAYNTSSDYRLKENVDYDFTALDRVAQLKPARFNFIADADTTVDGFLAHEVQEIVPEAVTGEKDGETMQGMDYGRITPLLVKAIQEQQTLIESLTARIETLEE